MKLALLPGTFAVCRLLPDQEVPHWVWKDKTFLSVAYTDDELSIVCSQSSVPPDVHCEKNWKAIKVQGPLDFSLTRYSGLLWQLLLRQVEFLFLRFRPLIQIMFY